MKTATISELKNELKTRHPRQIAEICIRLAKFKKENKELLTYLLFDADDEEGYIQNVKEEIAAQFEALNKSNLYIAKKMIRKILRNTNKYIRYSGDKRTEVEVLIFYCKKLRRCGVPLHKSMVLGNLYFKQIQKINKALATLHEDLQYDYSSDIEELNRWSSKELNTLSLSLELTFH